MEEIKNRVAGSGLVTIDLEDFIDTSERVFCDISPWLFQGLILKEKDFRHCVETHDWSQYQGKLVAIGCSTDAIIPTWAYMLAALALRPFSRDTVFGDISEIDKKLFAQRLAKIDTEQYRDARVVVKGCGDKRIPTNAYIELCNLLQPVVRSIMYGEPCSTVPLFKSKPKR